MEVGVKKFLKLINSGIKSTSHFYEQKIREVGKENDRNYRFITLNNNNIIFEDVDKNAFYQGKINKSSSSIEIDEIEKLNIYDEGRENLLEQTYEDIIDGLLKEDYKKSDKAFDKLKLLKFRAATVPSNGYVHCRDNEVYKITINEDKENIDIKSILESTHKNIKNKLITENGEIKKVVIKEDKEIKKLINTFPKKEIAEAKIACERMKLQKYYENKDFIENVFKLAKLTENKQLDQAILEAIAYLDKEQTLLLLTESELEKVTEYALATKGVFNHLIGKHVSDILYESGMQAFGKDLKEFWESINKDSPRDEYKLLLEQFGGSQFGQYSNTLGNIGTLLNSMLPVALNATAAYLKNIETPDGSAESVATKIEEKIKLLEKGQVDNYFIDTINGIFDEMKDFMGNLNSTLMNYDTNISFEEEVEEEEGKAIELEGTEDEVESDLGGLDSLGGSDTGGLGDLGGDASGEDIGLGGEDEGELEDEEKKEEDIDLFGESKKIDDSLKKINGELEEINSNKNVLFENDDFEDRLDLLIDEAINLGPDGINILGRLDLIREDYNIHKGITSKNSSESSDEFPFIDYNDTEDELI